MLTVQPAAASSASISCASCDEPHPSSETRTSTPRAAAADSAATKHRPVASRRNRYISSCTVFRACSMARTMRGNASTPPSSRVRSCAACIARLPRWCAGTGRLRIRRLLSRGSAKGEVSVRSLSRPVVDVFEDSEAITLKVELPEVNADDVDIQLEGNALTMRGERKLENVDKKEGYHRVERSYGSFSRRFTLPSTVEMANVTAQSRDGVLRIFLPKKAETKPRQIVVQTHSSLGGQSKQKQ